MNEVPIQQYVPNQYIRFNYGNSNQGISKIKSAGYIKNKGWLYTVENPMAPESIMHVDENQIIETVDAV